MVGITLAELRRLFDRIVIARIATLDHTYKWSIRRRNHEQRARQHHYRRSS